MTAETMAVQAGIVKPKKKQCPHTPRIPDPTTIPEAQAFLEDNSTDGMIPVKIEIRQHGSKVRIRIHRKGVSMTLLFDADLLECIDSDDRR